MLKINRKYIFLAVLIFLVEVFIALYVRDRFIRPYGGDVLVVILIYCFLRGFLDVPVLPLALAVLAFAFAVEFLQYFHLVDRLGWGDSKLATVVLGNSFAWKDLVAYCLGVALVIGVEKLIKKGK